jgi:hypothetical protein
MIWRNAITCINHTYAYFVFLLNYFLVYLEGNSKCINT